MVVYSITVANSGNTALTAITVDDPSCDADPAYVSGDAGTVGTLDPGESWLYTCARTVTQAAMNAGGSLRNSATADAAETGPATDSHDIPIAQDPALTIAKTADPTSTGATGPIHYTITVRNTGNVDLTGVVLTDTLTGGATKVSGDTVNPGVLDVDETWVYTASYTVTQADLDAGDPIVNTASVDTSQTMPQSDDATTTITRQPGLAVAKTSTTTSVTAAGQVVPYAIAVTQYGQRLPHGHRRGRPAVRRRSRLRLGRRRRERDPRRGRDVALHLQPHGHPGRDGRGRRPVQHRHRRLDADGPGHRHARHPGRPETRRSRSRSGSRTGPTSPRPATSSRTSTW